MLKVNTLLCLQLDPIPAIVTETLALSLLSDAQKLQREREQVMASLAVNDCTSQTNARVAKWVFVFQPA